MTHPPIEIRSARDEDALEIIELIGSVFGEYPHCVLDVDGEMPELRHVATYFASHEGAFWVAEQGDRIVGMCGFTPKDGGGIELKKLYVHRRARKTGLGARLLSKVEERAAADRRAFIDLWSDTRFTTAHAFYERRGYQRGPSTRSLYDKSASVEFYFKKPLTSQGGQ